jgi:hypothetical protein
MFNDHEAIHEHLIQSGFVDNYFIWTKHGVNMDMMCVVIMMMDVRMI